jgi:hypothetical protein
MLISVMNALINLSLMETKMYRTFIMVVNWTDFSLSNWCFAYWILLPPCCGDSYVLKYGIVISVNDRCRYDWIVIWNLDIVQQYKPCYDLDIRWWTFLRMRRMGFQSYPNGWKWDSSKCYDCVNG